MAEDKKYLNLNGLQYYTRKLDEKKANIESPVFTGTPMAPTASLTDESNQLATTKFVKGVLGTQYVLKTGDTMTGPLKFNSKVLPVLDLKFTNPANGSYSFATNASLFVGDGTSNAGARLYFCRNVPALNTALLTSTSLGYNPRDELNYKNSTDYGIKFDVNIASNALERPTAIRQCASFFVGIKGAYVGYSGNQNMALTPAKVYRILDSNSIKEDEYIKSLEERIALLEQKLEMIDY